jgi:hypothetical protein
MTLNESWAMREFFWRIRNAQEAKIERIVSEYTNAFRQPLTIKQAASWVQGIIAKTLWVSTRCITSYRPY